MSAQTKAVRAARYINDSRALADFHGTISALVFFLKMFYLFYNSPRDRWCFLLDRDFIAQCPQPPPPPPPLLHTALLRTGKGPRKRVTMLLPLLFFWKLKTLKIKTSNKLQKKKMKSVVYFLCLIVLFFQILLVFYFLFPTHHRLYLELNNVIMHWINARVNFQTFSFWFHSFCR